MPFDEGYYYRQRQITAAREQAGRVQKQIVEREKQVQEAEKEISKVQKEIEDVELKKLSRLDIQQRGQQQLAIRNLQSRRLQASKDIELAKLKPYKEKIAVAREDIGKAKASIKSFHEGLRESKIAIAPSTFKFGGVPRQISMEDYNLLYGDKTPTVSIQDIGPDKVAGVSSQVIVMREGDKTFKDYAKQATSAIWAVDKKVLGGIGSGIKYVYNKAKPIRPVDPQTINKLIIPGAIAIPSIPLMLPYVGKIKGQDTSKRFGTDYFGFEQTTLGNVVTSSARTSWEGAKKVAGGYKYVYDKAEPVRNVEKYVWDKTSFIHDPIEKGAKYVAKAIPVGYREENIPIVLPWISPGTGRLETSGYSKQESKVVGVGVGDWYVGVEQTTLGNVGRELWAKKGNIPIAMPYIKNRRGWGENAFITDNPTIGNTRVGVELTTLGAVSSAIIPPVVKGIDWVGGQVSQLSDVDVPKIITIDQTGKFRDIPIAYPTREGIAALGYGFTSKETREQLKEKFRGKPFFEPITWTKAGKQTSTYFEELGAGVQEKTGSKALSYAPSVAGWVIAAPLMATKEIASGIEEQRPEVIEAKVKSDLDKAWIGIDVPEGYTKGDYGEWFKESSPQYKEALLKQARMKVGIGSIILGGIVVGEAVKGYKWLRTQEVYRQPVMPADKTKIYGKYTTKPQTALGGKSIGGRNVYETKTYTDMYGQQAKVTDYNIYGKYLTPKVGSKTIVTEKWRRLLNLKPTYAGTPYGTVGREGYTKALKLLTKPIKEGGQFGKTLVEAKGILRYKAPQIVQQTVKGTASRIVTPTSDYLVLKDYTIRTDFLGTKKASLIQKGTAIGKPGVATTPLGKVEGMEWVKQIKTGKLVGGELPIYKSVGKTKEFVITKFKSKYPVSFYEGQFYPSGKSYVGRSFTGKGWQKVSPESIRKLAVGKEKIVLSVNQKLPEGITKVTKIDIGKILKTTPTRPLTAKEIYSGLTKAQIKAKETSFIETLKNIYGSKKGAARLFPTSQQVAPSLITPSTATKLVKTRIEAFPSFFTFQPTVNAQTIFGATSSSTLVALSPALVPLIKSKLIQTPQVKLLNIQQQVPDVIVDVAEDTVQDSSQVPALKVPTITKQVQIPITPQIPRVRVTQTPRPPQPPTRPTMRVIPPPPPGTDKLIAKLKQLQKQNKSVDIVTGMKLNRKKTIGKNLPPFKALKIASEYVDRNIEASFRLKVNPKPPKQRDIPKYNPGSKFRPSKRDALYVVEHRKFRLDMPGEKRQIKLSPKKFKTKLLRI